MKKAPTTKTVKKSAVHIVLIISSILMLIPFLWMISCSLKSPQEIYALPQTILPKRFAWENYVKMFQSAPWATYTLNTVKVASLVTLGQVVTSCCAAYAFSRLKFKGKNILFVIYISTMMIPYQVMMIPTFKIVSAFGWVNSHKALIIPAVFSSFGVFMLRQFFMAIPKELEEAARIDGCSYPRIFWEIIIKNSKGGIITLALLTFMSTWNDFLRPLIYLNDSSLYTLSLGLSKFQGSYSTEWGQMMAGTLISLLPILIVYLCCQKYFVEGIAMSGIKE